MASTGRTGRTGRTATIAHEMRSGDDNIFVRGIIESYTFATFAKVTKYLNGRVDVLCGSFKFTNVEVMVLGVNGWGIKPVPAVGDRVLLVASQAPIIDLAQFTATETMPAYDESGLKAIVLTDVSKATQLITVNKDGITITGKNKLTINDSRVQFEDANGNKVITDSSGVQFEDKNKNKVTTASSGIMLEDANGSSHNKIVTSSSGISITDTNGNKIISDNTNGVKINDKLQIKK